MQISVTAVWAKLVALFIFILIYSSSSIISSYVLDGSHGSMISLNRNLCDFIPDTCAQGLTVVVFGSVFRSLQL